MESQSEVTWTSILTLKISFLQWNVKKFPFKQKEVSNFKPKKNLYLFENEKNYQKRKKKEIVVEKRIQERETTKTSFSERKTTPRVCCKSRSRLQSDEGERFQKRFSMSFVFLSENNLGTLATNLHLGEQNNFTSIKNFQNSIGYLNFLNSKPENQNHNMQHYSYANNKNEKKF